MGGTCAAGRASVQEINNEPFLVIGTVITLRDPQSVLTVTQGPRRKDTDSKEGCALYWTGVKQFLASTISSATFSDTILACGSVFCSHLITGEVSSVSRL